MLLKPRALQLVTAVKASLSAVIAIGLAMAFGWDKPYWAGISTMVVTLPYMGASLEKALMRIIATACAGLAAYLLTASFVQDQALYVAVLSVILIFTGYFGAGTWYPYAFLLFGITTVLICAMAIQNPTEIWNITFFRVSEISLGVLVALAVNAIILPQSAGQALVAKIGKDIKDCTTLLRYACQTYLSDDQQTLDTQVLEEKITTAITGLRPLMRQAQKDSYFVAHHHTDFEQIITCMENLFVALTVMRRAAEARFPKEFKKELEPKLTELADALQSRLEHIGDAFRKGKMPDEANLLPYLDAIDARIDDIRVKGTVENYPIEDTTHFYAILANLSDIRLALDELSQAAKKAYSITEARHIKNPHEAGTKNGSTIDKRRLAHGLKVAVACIASIYLWLWTNWEGGLQAIITAAIVVQISIVASNQKSLLRLGGCLLGASLGGFSMIFVEPYVSTYAAFSIPLFLCFFIFAFINYGKPAYAYAGFQAFIAFLLMTAVTNEQNVSLLGGVHRFFGILVGITIVAVVQRLMWPIIPERELRHDFTYFFERASTFLRNYTPVRLTGKRAPEAQAMLKGKVSPVARDAEFWLAQIAFRGNEHQERAKVQKFALSMQSISYRLRALEQTFQREMPPSLLERLAPQVLQVNEAVVKSMDQLAEAFRTATPPQATVDFDQPARALSRAIHSILRIEHAARPYPGSQVAGVLGLSRRYRSLLSDARICQNLAQEIDYKVLQRTPFF